MKFHEVSLRAKTFAEMGLPPEFLNAVEKLGFKEPTPIQAETIPTILGGTDLIGVAQTGSGKTLAYALGVLNHLTKNPKARGLVLLPSRETAEQVGRVFEMLTTESPISLCLVAPGIPNDQQVKQLRKNPRLIMATPGRLVDHLRTNKLLLQGLEVLVLDEADRMLDLGFEEQLRFIQNTLRGARQTLMFAASFGSWAEAIARLLMRPEASLVRSAGAETAVATLKQKVYFLNVAQKDFRLLDELKRMKGGVIVFADSQESCVTVGRLLAHHQFSSDFVHGDMKPGHRNRVLREFREGKIQIMVTTDLLARGLDIPHVTHVVNYELPFKSEDFLHRIGRTARAGREGTAITFITPTDDRTYRKIKTYLEGAEEVQL